jgi:hypothetical protein
MTNYPERKCLAIWRALACVAFCTLVAICIHWSGVYVSGGLEGENWELTMSRWMEFGHPHSLAYNWLWLGQTYIPRDLERACVFV